MTAVEPPGRAPDRRARATLASLAGPIFGLLSIEFIFGMALALYLPPASSGGASIVTSSPVLALHILVAVFLVGITSRALVLALRLGDRRASAAAGLGVLSSLGAFLAGLWFTFGGQTPNASFAMALGFLGVTVAAALLLAAGSASRPESLAPQGPPTAGVAP